MVGARDSRADTLDGYFSALAGPIWRSGKFLKWPPDVFCLLASLLQRTGAYTRLVRQWPPPKKGGADVRQWAIQMTNRGRAWWRFANAHCTYGRKCRAILDSRVRKNWQCVMRHKGVAVQALVASRETEEHGEFWAAVFELMAAADEACTGIGMVQESHFVKQERRKVADNFLFDASVLLASGSDPDAGSASLCRHVPPHLGSVLPKMHTPQSGLTLRSISHHLAYLRPSEVTVSFKSTLFEPISSHSLNVLFIPWPDDVRPTDFQPVDCLKQKTADGFRFFTFAPKRPDLMVRTGHISRLLDAAAGLVGKVDGVILPELALGAGEEDTVVNCIRKKAPEAFLISGVGAASDSGRFGENKAIFSPAAFRESFEQAKHHRWQLDRSQIDQYGLGSNLDPAKRWWEHIPIGSRTVNLVPISDTVTLAILICEDLARQDPVADVIRSVGPNLVVALLMDGPQLSGRWPAHYATVFADDPGSSVLTVTSVGMSHLCRPKDKPVSRVVGLWKDKLQGFREIELPKDADALVLTLTMDERAEWSADGRHDDGKSTYLTLNGIHPVHARL